jgi:flagellar motor protein MotB
VARAGRFDEAKQLVASAGDSVASLDLLARVEAQQGHADAARSHWRRVSELDAGHAGAIAGLAWLDEGGQPTAYRLVTMVVLLAGLAVGVGLTLAAVRFQARNVREQVREEEKLFESRLEQRLAALAVVRETVSRERPQPATLSLPEDLRRALHDDGFEMRNDGDGFLVLFPDRVFRDFNVLMPGMAERLSALGSRLAPYTANLEVEILGSADASPIKKGERFGDNIDLALARALLAGRWITNSARWSVANLSYGVRLPLLANGDPLDRRNRTVALRIRAAELR